jgi:hypothetical protein
MRWSWHSHIGFGRLGQEPRIQRRSWSGRRLLRFDVSLSFASQRHEGVGSFLPGGRRDSGAHQIQSVVSSIRPPISGSCVEVDEDDAAVVRNGDSVVVELFGTPPPLPAERRAGFDSQKTISDVDLPRRHTHFLWGRLDSNQRPTDFSRPLLPGRLSIDINGPCRGSATHLVEGPSHLSESPCGFKKESLGLSGLTLGTA